MKSIQGEVKDWKGNVIKAGDEICRIVTERPAYSFGWCKPGESDITPIMDYPAQTGLWEKGPFFKVLGNEEGWLFFRVKEGEYTFAYDISMFMTFLPNSVLLAIKGVSDEK